MNGRSFAAIGALLLYVALPSQTVSAGQDKPMPPDPMVLVADNGEQLVKVAQEKRVLSHLDPMTNAIVTGTATVTTYSMVPRLQASSPSVATSCAVTATAFQPTVQHDGARVTAQGFSQLRVGAGCSGTITWYTQLLIFQISWHGRGKSRSLTTPPGVEDYALASSQCSLSTANSSWMNQISNGGAAQAVIPCRS